MSATAANSLRRTRRPTLIQREKECAAATKVQVTTRCWLGETLLYAVDQTQQRHLLQCERDHLRRHFERASNTYLAGEKYVFPDSDSSAPDWGESWNMYVGYDSNTYG